MNCSFIIPVYNSKDYLPACVESICAINIEDFEILLINDGSTDGSGILCDALAQDHAEIRVVHQANGGASAARNRGIQEAVGDKLIFIDADDSLDSDALREILSDSRCDHADMVIFGMTFDYYHHGECYRRDPMCFNYDGVLTAEDWSTYFVELFKLNSLSPLWNKVFKRKFLMEDKLLLNENMFLYEDFEFVLRYLQHCNTIWNIPKAIYHYRQPEDEGNAKYRLARIPRISEFLNQIEVSLEELRRINPAVSEEQTAEVLQQLYLVLTVGKLSASDLNGIRDICRDFRQWAENRMLPMKTSKLQQRLMDEKALMIYIANKKTALRHKIAVKVKVLLNRG